MLCEHQDIVGQAFTAHLENYLNVVVEDVKCLSMFWVGGLPRLSNWGIVTIIRSG